MTTSLEGMNKYVWPEKKSECVESNATEWGLMYLYSNFQVKYAVIIQSVHSENVLEMEEQDNCKSNGKQNELDNCHRD